MRLWSLHPKYLDAKGLVALWREGLLAKYVLEGKTKGYKHHPQLERFKKSSHPLGTIHYYLYFVAEEAHSRGYNFDESKLISYKSFAALKKSRIKLFVTSGQIEHERKHLENKLKVRDRERYKGLKTEKSIELHQLFKVVKGDVEPWEKIYDATHQKV